MAPNTTMGKQLFPRGDSHLASFWVVSASQFLVLMLPGPFWSECQVAMGHNLWLYVGVDEHLFATYMDVHQGYRVLTHSQVAKAVKKKTRAPELPELTQEISADLLCHGLSHVDPGLINPSHYQGDVPSTSDEPPHQPGGY